MQRTSAHASAADAQLHSSLRAVQDVTLNLCAASDVVPTQGEKRREEPYAVEPHQHQHLLLPPTLVLRDGLPLQNADNASTLYAENLLPLGDSSLLPASDLASFQRSLMQQQIAAQNMQCMQQLQLLQQRDQHFQFPVEHEAAYSLQAQQQLLMPPHSHQLMLMMQQHAEARPVHLPYGWGLAQLQQQAVPVPSPATNAPKFEPALAAQAAAAAAASNSRLALPAAACATAAHAVPPPAPAEAQPKSKKAKNSENGPVAKEVAVASVITITPKPLQSELPLIGCGGKLAGQFDHPIGVTVHRGHIIVCDHDNHRVQVLRCWDGVHVRSFGGIKPSKQAGKFHRPQGVAVDCDNNIIVTDQGNHRIQSINYISGQQVLTIGTFGAGARQFANPCGLAIHPSGHIVVCDSGNHRLQILDASGGYVRCIGSYGRDPGQFKSPLSVCCSRDGERLFVVEYGNLRVQVLRWSDGGHMYTINKYFKPKTSWCPSGVACDDLGRVLVVNSDSNCIEVFRIDGGSFVRSIQLAAPTIVGPITPETQLSRPRGLALSDTLDIVVTDHGLNHVQVIPKHFWYID